MPIEEKMLLGIGILTFKVGFIMIAAAATTLRLLPLKNFYTKVKKASVLQ
jgi:uncharacterized integral membrane protein